MNPTQLTGILLSLNDTCDNYLKLTCSIYNGFFSISTITLDIIRAITSLNIIPVSTTSYSKCCPIQWFLNNLPPHQFIRVTLPQLSNSTINSKSMLHQLLMNIRQSKVLLEENELIMKFRALHGEPCFSRQ